MSNLSAKSMTQDAMLDKSLQQMLLGQGETLSINEAYKILFYLFMYSKNELSNFTVAYDRHHYDKDLNSVSEYINRLCQNKPESVISASFSWRRDNGNIDKWASLSGEWKDLLRNFHKFLREGDLSL